MNTKTNSPSLNLKIAELIMSLGFDDMAKEFLSGQHSGFRTFGYIQSMPAFKSWSEKKQKIVNTAMYLCEKEAL